MLRIRLTRVGKRNNAHFRVVVAEHSRPVKGKFIELLGTYSPIKKDVTLNKERIEHWISHGAAPSDTVARLLKNQGMKNMEKFIKHVTFVVKPKAEEPAPAAAPAAPAKAPEAPKAEAPAEEPKAEAPAEEAPAQEEAPTEA